MFHQLTRRQTIFFNLCNGFVLRLSMLTEKLWLESLRIGFDKCFDINEMEVIPCLNSATHQSMAVVNSCCYNALVLLSFTNRNMWILMQHAEIRGMIFIGCHISLSQSQCINVKSLWAKKRHHGSHTCCPHLSNPTLKGLQIDNICIEWLTGYIYLMGPRMSSDRLTQ